MANTFLVVIPTDPHAAIPTAADAIKTKLAKMAGTDQARIKDYGKLQFIDCGEAFEHIACPSCASVLTVAQWHAFMDEDWHVEDGFHMRKHDMPCCPARHDLNALVYVPHQGFSNWFISAMATKRGALTAAELASLEDVAKLPLRAIIQQY